MAQVTALRPLEVLAVPDFTIIPARSSSTLRGLAVEGLSPVPFAIASSVDPGCSAIHARTRARKVPATDAISSPD
jgi:hypothetical protein